MENASKALIIAGAILLSILIIGLGMLVFNQARDAITGSNLDAEKAEAFNSKFMSYMGETVTGSQVKSLVDLVINNNNTVSKTENPTITLAGKSTATDLAAYRNTLKNATRYKVVVAGYDSEGRINKITINGN
ncbi:MAG: hypothetical protein J6A29_06630 [Clostridia bacterium]|nr:hypothetical protein [Clostridia bacterium]